MQYTKRYTQATKELLYCPVHPGIALLETAVFVDICPHSLRILTLRRAVFTLGVCSPTQSDHTDPQSRPAAM